MGKIKKKQPKLSFAEPTLRKWLRKNCKKGELLKIWQSKKVIVISKI